MTKKSTENPRKVGKIKENSNSTEGETKAKPPAEEPDHEYTWVLRNRMRERLLSHRIEKNIAWDDYQYIICKTLGLEPVNSGLNENDPRSWIWYDRDPSDLKLNRYARYIKTQYPDFDFFAGYEQEYLEFAVSFSSFSLTKREISDLEKAHFAKKLAGRILISRSVEELHDGRSDRDFDLLYLRGIGTSPFLSFTVFKSTIEQPIKHAWVKTKFLSQMDSDTEFNKQLAEGQTPYLTAVSAVRFGILCPTRTPGQFHGIMRDETYNAKHVLARFDKDILAGKEGTPTDVSLDTREISFLEEDLLSTNFTVTNFQSTGLKEFFEKIGEPAL